MTLEDLKTEIEQRTGIPATILNGESAEELIAQAKALHAYRKQYKAEAPKDTRTLFAEWIKQTEGEPETDPAGDALNGLEEELRISNGGYPYMQDGGEVTNMPDPRTPAEQFGEWFSKQAAFDPFKGDDGWKRINI